MASSPSSSSLFQRMVNVWRLLSLRSDVDNVILELLGQFSLEKIYADSDLEIYQNLVITLLTQLNAIFYIQRMSLPSGAVEVGWYLGFLASWEVIARTVEFVAQTMVESKAKLKDAPMIRDKHLPEALLSMLRVLMLHPKAPANHRAKERRARFARIHNSLEGVYDTSYNPRSFLLSICRDTTTYLSTDADALELPPQLKRDLPTLTTELYPLPDCLSSQYVSTIVPPDDYSGDWLSQFLALRDVSHFLVGASIQYVVYKETRDVRLLTSSAKTRSALLKALENMQVPPHLSKADMIATFTCTLRMVLPDTPMLPRPNASIYQVDENEIDALDGLCRRLSDRNAIQRISDRELMHSISEITRSIALLDDPNGHFRSPCPTLYALNCQNGHVAGGSQLRYSENFKIPLDPREHHASALPASTCVQCEEVVTKVQEIPIARYTWEILKPLECTFDAIKIERHLPTQFQLLPPKAETRTAAQHTDHNVQSPVRDIASSVMSEPAPPYHSRQSLSASTFPFPSDRSRSVPTLSPPRSPGIAQGFNTPLSDHFPSEGSTFMEKSSQDEVPPFIGPHPARRLPPEEPLSPAPFSPDTVGPPNPFLQQSVSAPTPDCVHFPKLDLVSPSVPLEKRRSKWRSKLTMSRKESTLASGDSSSLSSSTLESQKLEEIGLDSLLRASKAGVRAKFPKNVNICLSQNSTFALLWTQPLIHIWDVGASGPNMVRSIVTQSSCLLAAVTKVYLAYVIGTRDQKLTLRIVNLVQQSVPVVEYRMPSTLWCRSIAICPKENYVAVGFDNSVVRLYRTDNAGGPREDRLHSHYHRDCKDCPPAETLSFSSDGTALLASTRNAKTGTVQLFSWQFPFSEFQEHVSCRYRVPLHESEDNGVSSAVLRSKSASEEELICVTTWTQSGVPVLIQPKDGYRTEIGRTQISKGHGKLGNRVQCASFSNSGKELAIVNDKGSLYHVSSLNSSPLQIRKLATSKELTAKSDSFAMTFTTIADEETILLAWADPSKAVAYIKKVPVTHHGEVQIPPTPTTMPIPAQAELSAEPRAPPKLPAELDVTELSPVDVETPRDIPPISKEFYT